MSSRNVLIYFREIFPFHNKISSFCKILGRLRPNVHVFAQYFHTFAHHRT